jgi:hypothetical protein
VQFSVARIAKYRHVLGRRFAAIGVPIYVVAPSFWQRSLLAAAGTFAALLL